MLHLYRNQSPDLPVNWLVSISVQHCPDIFLGKFKCQKSLKIHSTNIRFEFEDIKVKKSRIINIDSTNKHLSTNLGTRLLTHSFLMHSFSTPFRE